MKVPATETPAASALLTDAADRAIRYLEEMQDRSVYPSPEAVRAVEALGGPMPVEPQDPGKVLAQLDALGSPATVASAGPRYFGFVIGGSLPVSVAANWLAAAWDQNAGLAIAAPGAARLEEVVLRWLIDIFGLPPSCGGGFTTCATSANFAALAAARHALLERQQWDVEARGLIGAPPLRIVAGDDVHVSVLKALMLVGLGRETVRRVPADDQGRIRVGQIGPLDEHTILCLQVGNVNSG